MVSVLLMAVWAGSAPDWCESKLRKNATDEDTAIHCDDLEDPLSEAIE